jgi:hypothetical protein
MDFFGNAWISPDFYSWEKNHGEGRQEGDTHKSSRMSKCSINLTMRFGIL